MQTDKNLKQNKFEKKKLNKNEIIKKNKILI